MVVLRYYLNALPEATLVSVLALTASTSTSSAENIEKKPVSPSASLSFDALYHQFLQKMNAPHHPQTKVKDSPCHCSEHRSSQSCCCCCSCSTINKKKQLLQLMMFFIAFNQVKTNQTKKIRRAEEVFRQYETSRFGPFPALPPAPYYTQQQRQDQTTQINPIILNNIIPQNNMQQQRQNQNTQTNPIILNNTIPQNNPQQQNQSQIMQPNPIISNNTIPQNNPQQQNQSQIMQPPIMPNNLMPQNNIQRQNQIMQPNPIMPNNLMPQNNIQRQNPIMPLNPIMPSNLMPQNNIQRQNPIMPPATNTMIPRNPYLPMVPPYSPAYAPLPGQIPPPYSPAALPFMPQKSTSPMAPPSYPSYYPSYSPPQPPYAPSYAQGVLPLSLLPYYYPHLASTPFESLPPEIRRLFGYTSQPFRMPLPPMAIDSKKPAKQIAKELKEKPLSRLIDAPEVDPIEKDAKE